VKGSRRARSVQSSEPALAAHPFHLPVAAAAAALPLLVQRPCKRGDEEENRCHQAVGVKSEG